MDLTPFVIGSFVLLLVGTCALALIQNARDVEEETKHKTEQN